MKTTTQLPVDQLRPPEDDVRTHRPDEQVRSLANSMGDPDVDQLQPILAYPVGYEDLEVESSDDLDDLVRDGHEFEILDGTTRYLAARDHLKWHSLWTWIHDEPPENATLARLDANTERITMSEFETVRAIVDHKRDTGKTWAEIAEETGWSPSYLSQVSTTLEGPDWLTDAWQDPEIPITTSHANRFMRAMGPKFQGQLLEYGDMTEEEAAQRAERLAQNLLEWTVDYGWSPTELDDAISRKWKEILDELAGPSGHREKQREAEKDQAAAMHGAPKGQAEEDLSCVICGNDWTTRIAVPVCDEDRGLLADHVGKGQHLMDTGEPQQAPPQAELEALAKELDLPVDAVRQRLEAD